MFRYSFHWRPVLEGLPAMLAGCLVTIEIAVLSILAGIVFGVLLALARTGRTSPWTWVANSWIEVARNTPALFQIYLAYFGLGSLGIHLNSYLALVAGITFNNAGYLAETCRGGLRAIPGTQIRAARSLGMTAGQGFRLIVLPQLFRIVYYPITNQMILAVLMTALGLTVGLDSDLAGVTQQFNVLTYRTFEYFSVAAVLYYLIAKVLMLAARLFAWRLFRY
jgi:His/Glu/Gln/Arg/opine family amino acid ABC transporter permease subunit